MGEFVFVYVTCSSVDEARRIAETVVEERLAACANIYSSIESIYWWRGRVEHSGEAALILKTRRILFSRLVKRIRELHSYELPCIIALPIIDGLPPFLKWIEDETKG